MLELAVELGNSHLVQLLLDERAMVHPEGDAVPPLMMAVFASTQEKCAIATGCEGRPVEDYAHRLAV